MLSVPMGNSCTAGHRNADITQDYGPLPTLLSHTQNIVKMKGAKEKANAKGAVEQSIVMESKIAAILANSAEKKDQKKKTEPNAEMKRFVDAKDKLTGAPVEYYSKSYGEWIPAIIGDARPNGCLTLLHVDGSVLKVEADPDSVRLASEQAGQNSATLEARQNSATFAKFNSCFSDCALERCSQVANSINQANPQQHFREGLSSEERLKVALDNERVSEALLSVARLHAQAEVPAEVAKQACDQQMKNLHSLSEKFTTQLRIHRGLSEGMVQDQQLELSQLEFRRNLDKALGRDLTNVMQSTDEQRAAQNREEWLKILNN